MQNDKSEIVPLEVPKSPTKHVKYHQFEVAQDPKLNQDFQAWVLGWQ